MNTKRSNGGKRGPAVSCWSERRGSNVRSSAAGERLVDRRLEAADVFHRHVLSVSGLQVLVQDGEDLVVEDLEFADSLDHLLQGLQGNKVTMWCNV